MTYEAEALARQFSAESGQAPHVGKYVKITLLDTTVVLVNPASVAFLSEVVN